MITTFVGRDHELVALAGARARAAGGRRQLVVVTGDAGIGKTWFCEQASAAAEHDGFAVVWGRCWPHGGAPALWPWPAMLPALAGPAGARLLAADSGRDGVDPERFARFAAVAELIAETRATTPTMIVIDDAHHADEGALLLARFLASTLDHLPLVLVLARRNSPAEGGANAEALLGELQRDATTIGMRPFDLTDTAALLAAHGQPDPDPELAATLLRVTGGSPLHLVRAVHLGWTGSRQATLRHAIAEAIARLSPPRARILAFAALLGVDGAVGELADLADESPAAVVAALAVASGEGLVDLLPGGWALHDLVREVALGQFDAAQLLDAHAGAAALLAGAGQPERVARHALAAAVRSDADAEIAIAACRTAAGSLFRGYAYEPAADLLDRAVALAEHRQDWPGRAELLVERAEAVLACGRLIDARAAFEAATEATELAGDPVLLARAVLGLAGVWVHEHRNAAVRALVLARQRRALRDLPETEHALRNRLVVRLAAEAVYEGERVELVLDALARARFAGDRRALAEALSVTHHALLGPEHAERRLPLAEEQIAVASAAGDGILALFGLLWRTVDLYLLGDARAGASLAELRQRTAALGVATADYIVTCIDVMRLIREGRLDEAEAATEPCLRLGLEVGDADATGYYGAQLLNIRWLQGRDDELADLLIDTVASGTLAVVEYGFRVSVVMVLARDGRLAEARAALAPLLDIGLANLPRSSTWLVAMAGLVEAAVLLDDPALAAQAAELLRPFADRPAMASLAVSCFGAVSRSLGLAAQLGGDPVTAVAHLEHAVRANQRLNHRPAVAVSQAQLADALVARGGPDDLPRARTLLTDAAGQARTMGMPRRAEVWSALVAALTPSDTPAVLRRRGGAGWTVLSGELHIELPNLVGLDYLARLLEHPGRDIPAVELAGAAVLDGRQELLDSAAIEAYRHRIREVDIAIDDAESTMDLATAERLRLERESVAGELARAVGLGGRLREFASSSERARTAVRKAIKRAVDAIAAADPVLGAELRGAIGTGTVCRYTPGGPMARPWRVDRD